MLLSLSNEHKQHLNILTDQPNQVLVDFCKLAFDYVQNGPNIKRYTVAAQKLDLTLEIIQNAVQGLVNLLLESCKHNLNDTDFRDSVITLGFNENHVQILSQFYEAKSKDIKQVLSKFAVTELHYHDLNWRFEAELASRSLLKQVTPIITMNLVLEKKSNIGNSKGAKSSINVQTDPCNLLHMTQVLEEALLATKSQQFKRLQRSFK